MRRALYFSFFLGAISSKADLAALLTPIEELTPDPGIVAAVQGKAPLSDKSASSEARTVRVSAEEVLGELARTLLDHYGGGGELQLTLLQEWVAPVVEHEAWAVELMRYPQQGLSSRMVLPIRISCGENSTEHQLIVNCRHFREVLVPSRKINRGEALSAEDFEIMVRDVLASPLPMVAATETIENYESKQILMPGKILSWRDIHEKPLIKRGQVVEVIAEEGFLRISVKGEALQDGKVGDYISVRNLTTRKHLQARILNEQMVQVPF